MFQIQVNLQDGYFCQHLYKHNAFTLQADLQHTLPDLNQGMRRCDLRYLRLVLLFLGWRKTL